MHAAWTALIEAGFATDAGFATESERLEPPSETDLLPSLQQHWQMVSGTRSEKMRQWLDASMAAGAMLTDGIPGPSRPVADRWLGNRLAFWPAGMPAGSSVGVVCSRPGRLTSKPESWFDAFRTAFAKFVADSHYLVYADGTPVTDLLDRAAERFGVARLTVRLFDSVDRLRDWGKRVRKIESRPDDADAATSELYLSPPIRHDGIHDETPARDRAVVALADRLLALSVRKAGNLHSLLQSRLDDSTWSTTSVFVAVGDELTEGQVADELLSLGAVGWLAVPPAIRSPLTMRDDNPLVMRADAFQPADFLTHWTRQSDGPWPGQTTADYLDDLILRRPGADHSPLAALHRIVVSRRLTAASDGIRGKTPVVSFTAIPLNEFAGRRVFRAHRTRWDFESYGICIRRTWLQSHGARPVIYGDESTWQELGTADRPFFQPATTRGDKPIDWSEELEWRRTNDLDLTGLAASDGLIFVRTDAEARELSRLSPWPVVSLTELTADARQND